MKKVVIPFLVSAAIVVVTFLLFDDLEMYFSDLLKNASGHPYSYAFVSFLVLTSDIVLPVPSSVLMYLNGYVLGLFIGSAVSLVSLIVSAVFGYYLGQLTSLGLKAKSDEAASSILQKYGGVALLLSRGIPIVSESICIVCGYNRMPFKRYILLNLIGYLPLCLVYAFCGSVGYDKNTFLISFGVSLVISCIFWFFGKTFLLKSKSVKAQ